MGDSVQQYIDEIVEAWPPFTDIQETQLRDLLKPVKVPVGTNASQ